MSRRGLEIWDSEGRLYTEDDIAQIQAELERRASGCSRERFEAWAKTQELPPGDAFEWAWRAWQAALTY